MVYVFTLEEKRAGLLLPLPASGESETARPSLI